MNGFRCCEMKQMDIDIPVSCSAISQKAVPKVLSAGVKLHDKTVKPDAILTRLSKSFRRAYSMARSFEKREYLASAHIPFWFGSRIPLE